MIKYIVLALYAPAILTALYNVLPTTDSIINITRCRCRLCEYNRKKGYKIIH